MDDFENKLGQILGNPEMMGKIMAMAQSFGNQEAPPEPPPQQEAAMPEFDLAAVQKLTKLMGNAGVDSRQQALLTALSPYISNHRIHKLEKAMRAANWQESPQVFWEVLPCFPGGKECITAIFPSRTGPTGAIPCRSRGSLPNGNSPRGRVRRFHRRHRRNPIPPIPSRPGRNPFRAFCASFCRRVLTLGI